MARRRPESVPEIVARMEAAGAVVSSVSVNLAALLGETPPPEPESEKEFMARVSEHARRAGWEPYHVYDSRKSSAGWPDLVLIPPRPGRLVFAELKTEDGALTADQLRFRDILLAAGEDWRLWRPADWPEILEVLR